MSKPSVLITNYLPSRNFISARVCETRKGLEQTTWRTTGFTLVELMIVLAVIAILLSLAIPTYQNYSIRAKIGEGLSVANGAKTSVSTACQENPLIDPLNNEAAGYITAPDFSTIYIEDIVISGTCENPQIEIQSRNTGTIGFDPNIVLLGNFSIGSGRTTWDCASGNTPNHLLPKTCRS